MARKKRERRDCFITGRITPTNYWTIKDLADNLFGGNFNEALNFALASYRWLEIMIRRMADIHEIQKSLENEETKK